MSGPATSARATLFNRQRTQLHYKIEMKKTGADADKSLQDEIKNRKMLVTDDDYDKLAIMESVLNEMAVFIHNVQIESRVVGPCNWWWYSHMKKRFTPETCVLKIMAEHHKEGQTPTLDKWPRQKTKCCDLCDFGKQMVDRMLWCCEYYWHEATTVDVMQVFLLLPTCLLLFNPTPSRVPDRAPTGWRPSPLRTASPNPRAHTLDTDRDLPA